MVGRGTQRGLARSLPAEARDGPHRVTLVPSAHVERLRPPAGLLSVASRSAWWRSHPLQGTKPHAVPTRPGRGVIVWTMRCAQVYTMKRSLPSLSSSQPSSRRRGAADGLRF